MLRARRCAANSLTDKDDDDEADEAEAFEAEAAEALEGVATKEVVVDDDDDEEEEAMGIRRSTATMWYPISLNDTSTEAPYPCKCPSTVHR
jgi:hypothetical protein